MPPSETTAAGFCSECGARADGNFCRHCGAQLAAEAESEDWNSVVAEATGADDRYGILQVLARLWRAPLDGLVKLSEDPAYKGHFTFFLTLLGLKLFLVYTFLPRTVAVLNGTEAADGAAGILRDTIVEYLGLMISVPLGYHLYRRVSSVVRTQKSWYRFWLLSLGLTISYELALFVAVAVLGAIVTVLCAFVLPNEVWEFIARYQLFDRVYALCTVILIVTLYALATRRYWQLDWPRTLAMTAGMIVLTSPVYYVLKKAVDGSGIVGLML